MRLESKLDFYLLFILVVKVVFVASALGHWYLSHKVSQTAGEHALDERLAALKQGTEFVFTIAAAVLLIYHFRPYGHPEPMTTETRWIFFLFGWVLIATADWPGFLARTGLSSRVN